MPYQSAGGGAVVVEIPKQEFDYYASRLLREAIRAKAWKVAELIDYKRLNRQGQALQIAHQRSKL